MEANTRDASARVSIEKSDVSLFFINNKAGKAHFPDFQEKPLEIGLICASQKDL